jgi:large subunit ribosomal protein L10
MAFTKEQKQKIIEDLKEKVARQKAMILVGITGFKVKDLNELRKKLKAAEGNIQVAKKTLIEIVFKEKKIDFDKNKFKEEIALVFGFKDEISPAKIVFQATQENENLKILAGYIENEFKTGEEIITLAQLPTREELLAKLVGSISNPISGLVNVLQGNIKGLLQVLAKAKT